MKKETVKKAKENVKKTNKVFGYGRYTNKLDNLARFSDERNRINIFDDEIFMER